MFKRSTQKRGHGSNSMTYFLANFLETRVFARYVDCNVVQHSASLNPAFLATALEGRFFGANLQQTSCFGFLEIDLFQTSSTPNCCVVPCPKNPRAVKAQQAQMLSTQRQIVKRYVWINFAPRSFRYLRLTEFFSGRSHEQKAADRKPSEARGRSNSRGLHLHGDEAGHE